MRYYVIVGLVAAAASPLFAQPAPAPNTPMGMARTVTRAEVQARVETRFAERDANRDGVLTTDELAMRGGQRGMKMRMRRGHMGGQQAMRDPNVAFDRLDANHDGSISRDEFARGRQMRIEQRIVVNQQGQPGAMGMDHGAMRGMHRGGGMMAGAMFTKADANHDGRVTLAEATAGALAHFDMIDANRDGRVTPEERAAGRARMMQMRKAG